jgi:DNA gyrase subunit A
MGENLAEVSETEAVLEFTQKGYVRRFSQRSYQRRQARQSSEANPGLQTLEEDVTLQVEPALTSQELLTFTRDGRAFTLAVEDIPPHPRQGKGVPLVNLLPDTVPAEAGAVVAQRVIQGDMLDYDLILVTRQGKIKRAPLREFTHLTGRGLTAIKVKEGDELAHVTLAEAGDDLVLGTSGGRLLRFPIDEENLPPMGRAAQGPQGIRMGKQETVVGCVRVQSSLEDLVLVSAAGYGKRLPVAELRVARRGDLGTQAMQFSLKGDTLVALLPHRPGDSLTLLTNQDRWGTLPVAQLARQGRTTESEWMIKLNRGELLAIVHYGNS